MICLSVYLLDCELLLRSWALVRLGKEYLSKIILEKFTEKEEEGDKPFMCPFKAACAGLQLFCRTGS